MILELRYIRSKDGSDGLKTLDTNRIQNGKMIEDKLIELFNTSDSIEKYIYYPEDIYYQLRYYMKKYSKDIIFTFDQLPEELAFINELRNVFDF